MTKSRFFKAYTIRGVGVLALKDEDENTGEPIITIMMEHPELDGRFTNTYTFDNTPKGVATRDEVFESKITDTVRWFANSLLDMDKSSATELVKKLPYEVDN